MKLAMGHSQPVLPPPAIVDLAIDFDGTISWNGHKMDRATLDRQLADAARQSPQPEIHVTADRLARYDTVAKVLSDAQRLGVRSMGIVNTNRFVEQ